MIMTIDAETVRDLREQITLELSAFAGWRRQKAIEYPTTTETSKPLGS